MRVTTPVNPYPVTAIGGLGTGVSAFERASSYATFAASVAYRKPHTIERAEDLSFGETEAVYDHKVEGKRVPSGNQAGAATEVLKGVVQSGATKFFHGLDREIGRPPLERPARPTTTLTPAVWATPSRFRPPSGLVTWRGASQWSGFTTSKSVLA
jgi:hypothetical protein